MLLYGILNLPSVQNYAKEFVVKELKSKLQTNLGIESVYFRPFSELQLNGVYLQDRNDSTILRAQTIHAGVDLLPLLDNQLIFNSAKLSDFDIYLSKDSVKAPLNIQFIIDAFKPKEDSKKAPLDVKINSLNIAKGRIRFDVKDQPHLNKFDANHIDITDLDTKLALKSIKSDSLNIQIKKLSLKEKSGLEIENLIVRLVSDKNHLSVKGFELDLANSILKFEKCEIEYPSVSTPAELIKHARFELKTTQSYITLKDIKAFVPTFEHFNDRILFNTQISGKQDSITVSKLSLDYGDKMHLNVSGSAYNLSDKDNMSVQASIDKLSVTTDGIEGLINNFSKDKKSLPKEIANLGTIEFVGNLNGKLKQLHAKGSLITDLGIINSDLDFGFNPTHQTSSFFKGNISTADFKLGELLSNKDIEDISFNFVLDASKPKTGKISGAIDGLIEKFVYKNYNYQNINIDGNFSDKRYDGLISFSDENGTVSADGLFDLSQNEPVLNFVARLKNVRFDKLNLSDSHKNSYLSMALNANFSGKDLDNAQGYLHFDSIRFIKPEKLFEMSKLSITAEGTPDNRTIAIESDLIKGEIKGAYSFSTIIPSIKKTLNAYLPSVIAYNETSKAKQKTMSVLNNLTFDFTIKNTENASDVFQLPFIIYSTSQISGFYNDAINRFKVEAFVPLIKAGGANLQAGYLGIENNNDEIKSNVSCGYITKNKSVNDLTLNLSAQNDIVNTVLSIVSEEDKKLKGELKVATLFSKPEKKLRTKIKVYASNFVVNKNLWQIGDSEIEINDNYIAVNGFSAQSKNEQNEQSLLIEGTYSPIDPNKQMNVILKNIDLDYVFTSLAIDALEFTGFASGTLNVSSIEKQPYAEINLEVKQFGFNNTKLGELKLFSDLDTQTKKVVLKGSLINENEKITQIDGYINPITQELSIDFDADQINIAFLNKYVKTLFNHVSGIGSGQVRLFGDFSDVTVEGKAYIEDGSLGITFLNTNYSFTDTVYLKKDLIYFNNIAFHDQKGNTALISGKVVHDYFANIMYYIGLTGNNFLMYNVTEKQNPMFFGTVYGSGSGSISGDERVVNIEANMRSEKNTHINMNFMEETATEYSFVTYKEKSGIDSLLNISDKAKINRLTTNSGMEINMNFYIDATPDATVELIMDPVGGDRLKGTGSGAMQFVWGSNKDPMIYGTYNINRGSYNFTFQKLLERKFEIQNGSFVQFRGDPFQANIDVKAIYRIVANLNDLDKEIVKNTGQTNVPVNCVMHLTGPLRKPIINLDIDLPSADPEIQRQIKSLMNSEDMINRQIVYLLIMSKFYTPSNAQIDQRTSDLAAVASATLSTQLSKILSQIDDRWQIGTNLRTSNGEFTNTEVELILSSKLLNDRILINGNFGYRDNPVTHDAFIGDIDIEVLMNRTGTWRVKAYNHYNEKYYYINNGRGVQTQGIGLLYRKDFDSLHELFFVPKILDNITKKDSASSTPKDTVSNNNNFVIMKK